MCDKTINFFLIILSTGVGGAGVGWTVGGSGSGTRGLPYLYYIVKINEFFAI